MPRRKQVRVDAEITVWPSSLPDDVGSIAPGGSGLSMECEDLGSRFLSDAVEQGYGRRSQWESEIDEPYFDAQMGDELLRSFGLAPTRDRTSTRPPPARAPRTPSLAQPRLPEDLEEYITPYEDLDLTEETIREGSLLDHEAEEAGEVESPHVRTDDVHTHGKRRGGHAHTSMRPPKLKSR